MCSPNDHFDKEDHITLGGEQTDLGRMLEPLNGLNKKLNLHHFNHLMRLECDAWRHASATYKTEVWRHRPGTDYDVTKRPYLRQISFECRREVSRTRTAFGSCWGVEMGVERRDERTGVESDGERSGSLFFLFRSPSCGPSLSPSTCSAWSRRDQTSCQGERSD